MKLTTLFGIAAMFFIGLAFGMFVSAERPEWTVLPDGQYEGNALQALNPFSFSLQAQPSPKDRIPEKAIAVWQDRVVLDIQDAEWATFTDTKSMEPVIMIGSNAIELRPENEEDVQVGDICSYQSVYAEGNIIHRVVLKSQDEQGTYFIFKGDNVPTSDPGRVRFDQIQRCVVAIIY